SNAAPFQATFKVRTHTWPNMPRRIISHRRRRSEGPRRCIRNIATGSRRFLKPYTTRLGKVRRRLRLHLRRHRLLRVSAVRRAAVEASAAVEAAGDNEIELL